MAGVVKGRKLPIDTLDERFINRFDYDGGGPEASRVRPITPDEPGIRGMSLKSRRKRLYN
jgi:hypothetical protein